MLTPEQVQGLQTAFERLSEPLVETLIADIARRVSEAGQLTSTAAYEIWRAQNLGKSREFIEKAVADWLGKSIPEVQELFKQAAEVGYNFDVSRLPVEAIPFLKNKSIQQIVNAAANLAEEDLKNITQTLGIINQSGEFSSLTDFYRQASDDAFMQVSTGVLDYNTAIRRACNALAQRGIQTIHYESGVRTSLEAAVRRNMMGGLGLMVEDISRQNHDDLGCDGWEISAHAASALDHEPIQGKQYPDKEYERLNSSLKRRIGTLNCGHNPSPVILGVNQPQYTKSELEQFRSDNAKGVDYEGRHFPTVYEATQYQRRIERSIRAQKRKVLIAQNQPDAENLQNQQIRLQTLKQRYQDFCRKTGLRTEDERLFVSGFGRKEAAKSYWDTKKLEKEASRYFDLGDVSKNVKEYLKEKAVIDTLSKYGIKYKQRISSREIIVEAGKPTISKMTGHAQENLASKPDRFGMTMEEAQRLVDMAKLTLYQQDTETIKFMSQDGYSVLNYSHELVTAVPQKWRKKYDQYLEEEK